jgi:hypothetical protein
VIAAPKADPMVEFVVHMLTAHVVAGLVAGAFVIAERLS